MGRGDSRPQGGFPPAPVCRSALARRRPGAAAPPHGELRLVLAPRRRACHLDRPGEGRAGRRQLPRRRRRRVPRPLGQAPGDLAQESERAGRAVAVSRRGLRAARVLEPDRAEHRRRRAFRAASGRNRARDGAPCRRDPEPGTRLRHRCRAPGVPAGANDAARCPDERRRDRARSAAGSKRSRRRSESATRSHSPAASTTSASANCTGARTCS